MRWQLLDSLETVVPGERIVGRARTRFPDELFDDHFPTFPVTPGVLLVELGAQTGGLLVQATVMERDGHWVFPVLSIVRESKFRRFVPPDRALEITTELVALRENAAWVRATLRDGDRRCATMALTLAFDPEGGVGEGDPQVLAAFSRAQFDRLGSPWRPRADEAGGRAENHGV